MRLDSTIRLTDAWLAIDFGMGGKCTFWIKSHQQTHCGLNVPLTVVNHGVCRMVCAFKSVCNKLKVHVYRYAFMWHIKHSLWWVWHNIWPGELIAKYKPGVYVESSERIQGCIDVRIEITWLLARFFSSSKMWSSQKVVCIVPFNKDWINLQQLGCNTLLLLTSGACQTVA